MADENIIDDSGDPELKLPQSSESQPSARQLTHAPLGEILLEARTAKKLTQKDVSNSLRISIKQITALETDDFALLPDAMITRGFIRNYARLLEIDAEPLLASY
ncbi:MAG: helix-turn-helix transcriptional regulator, partial [Methylotenera sp.]